jgi:hypothetical protein
VASHGPRAKKLSPTKVTDDAGIADAGTIAVK